MNKNDIVKLLGREEVENNPELKKDLNQLSERVHEYIWHYSIVTDLSPSSCEYLLNNGLDKSEFFQSALQLQAGEKRNQLIDVMLKSPINWDNINYGLRSISFIEAEKFLNADLSASKILDIALSKVPSEVRDQLMELALKHLNLIDWTSFSSYYLDSISIIEAEKLFNAGLSVSTILNVALSKELGETRDQLMDLALKRSINWNDYYNLNSISFTEAEKLLNAGLSASTILNVALSKELGETRDQLIDLALKHPIDWNNIYSYYLNSISLAEAEKLLNAGLNVSKILDVALSKELGEARDQLMKLALKHPIDWANISSYYLNSISIIEVEKLLNAGLNASKILDVALSKELGEARDQLMELALKHQIDWANISSYSLSSISLTEAEKLLNAGLSASTILNVALSKELGETRDQLIDLALKHPIDWNNIYPYYLKLSYIDELNKFLEHGLSYSKILEATLQMESGEQRDQFTDLALTGNIDWNSFESYYLKSASIDEFNKFLGLGLSHTKILVSALQIEDKNSRSQLISLALTEKIDWNSVHSYYLKLSSIDELNKFLEHGLSYTEILAAALQIEDTEQRNQLLDLALTEKVDWSKIYNLPNSMSLTDLESFLENGLPLNKALEIILNNSNYNEEFVHNAIELLLDKGANINSISYNYNLNNYKYMLELGCKTDFVLENLLGNFRQSHDLTNEQYNTASLSAQQKHLLGLAIEKGADLNKVFTDFSSITITTSILIASNVTGTDIARYSSIPSIIPKTILELLITDYSLNPDLILGYALNQRLPYLLDFAFTNYPTSTISLDKYITSFYRSSFAFSSLIVERFSNIYDAEKAYELLRSYGLSESSCASILDIHNLMLEYVASKKEESSFFSTLELQILNNDPEIENIEDYKNIVLTNNYGYTPLHLALIADNYHLATKMVKAGCNIYAKSKQNISPLQLIGRSEHPDKYFFIKEIAEIMDEVDIDLGDGESLADMLITDKAIEAKIIEKSHDSLFSLFKQAADLFTPSQDLSKTSIAISHGDDFWSTGVWSTSRLMAINHPNIKFYLVTDEMLGKGGENFLKQFDAVINPGAGDSYPRHLEEFGKEDCSLTMTIEKHYQTMLEQTDKLNIPSLGMCAGSQHFSMYHGGKLKPLDNYDHGQHQITFIAGTLAHFFSLSDVQQERALSNCEFPEISFKGDTAHHFAAVNDKLGDNIQLGAVSEDNIAMSYAHNNGIRYSTQYHPEHHYNADSLIKSYEELWLENFLKLAEMHHDYRVNGAAHPTDYFAFVKGRLDSCMSGEIGVDGEIV